jgi:hypothetical protein
MRSLTMRQHKYHLDGRCVYCLEKISPGEATTEHIIARALNGTLEIVDGSCARCASLSNESYEQTALNVDLLIPRRLLELKKSRNRGKKRQKAPVPLPTVAFGDQTMNENAKFNVQLSDAEYQPTFVLVQFPPAGLLVGENRGAALKGISLQIFNLGGRHGQARNVTTNSPMANGPFAKTLAKIGYCYAAAESGLETFSGNDIRDLLAGRRDDVYNFVGCALVSEHLAKRHLHGLYLRNRNGWLTVLVHLFASCDADERKPSVPYEVVVGRAL